VDIKTLLIAATLAGAALIAAAPQAETEIVDQVVAIVDDDVIMASELRERVTAVSANLKARGMQMPPEDELIR
jgi:peptidyl-prolyl cis-trans isomerase SurA